ncbi:MAG: ABC transporter substrate-binding protein [Gemella sp.]|nr:ABC transporter substrate-binding protein [Gemella sp.]
MKKQLKNIMVIATTLATLTAGAGNLASADEKKEVGIIQFAEHAALDASREGFLEGLKEAGFGDDKLEVKVQNSQGDQANLQTMVSTMKGENDLNFAIATPAAQALLGADDQTPGVFTAVTDPVAAGLTENLEKPTSNMTGSIDALDVEKQIDVFTKAVPNAKKIGIFYNANEVNSETQAKAAKKALEAKGIEVVEKTVTTTNDVEQAVSALAGQVDAVYFPTDNTVASTIATIGEVLKKAKKPAMGSDEAVLEGVLLTFGVDYKELGKQSGALAGKILKGEKVENLPVEKPAKASVKVNKEMAEAIGLSAETIEKDTK